MKIVIEGVYANYINNTTRLDGVEPLTIDEFIEWLLIDDQFNDEWSNGCTQELTDGEKAQLYLKKFPFHDPLVPVRRDVLNQLVPKRKLK